MSRIDDLIAEHCPNGVKYMPIGETADVFSGATPSRKVPQYWENGTIPWISSGEVNKGTIHKAENCITQSGYDSCSTKLAPERSVVVALAGQGKTRGMVARTRLQCCTNQSLATVVPLFGIDSDFLFYFLKTQYTRLREISSGDGTRGGLNLAMLRAYRVPVPPLEVQREIVRVLNTFTELESELESELEARRHQYEYYRDHLLTTSQDPSDWPRLNEVGEFMRGRRFTKSDIVLDGIPAIHYGDIYTHYGTTASSTLHQVDRVIADRLRFAQPRDVVFAGVGETVEEVGKAVAWLGDGSVAIHDDTFGYRSTLDPQFVSFWSQTADFNSQKARHVARAKVKRISAEGLGTLRIPAPPLLDQRRIVQVLSVFDALVNDLSAGLPAELLARRQQYEYFRDRLLMFTEAA